MGTHERPQMGIVYQFPGNVIAAAKRRAGERALAETGPRPGPRVECDSWYHEAAIQQAKQTRKP